MTASVLKQDPNTKKVQMNAFYFNTDTVRINRHSFESFCVWLLYKGSGGDTGSFTASPHPRGSDSLAYTYILNVCQNCTGYQLVSLG